VTDAPWAKDHELVRIGLKGYDILWENRPATNLVFLVDVSGSMNAADKLPLVKEGLKMLVRRLDARDSVAIVTYAGAERLALPSTTANNQETILAAIDNLDAGGSTNGAGGINAAYEQAQKHFNKDGVNRVILCTDGDFNVGITSRSDLVDLITDKARSGVFLSVCGFGTGNVQDSQMEQLADKGNGNYAYIDSEREASRVFMKNASGGLMTIAKDVKIQVEFNPAQVQAYRLIGYENRKLEAQDFNDDRKDAGEIGAGHTVTALYEVVPSGQPQPNRPSVDPLKYSEPAPAAEIDRKSSGDLLTVKLRYKAPDGDTSKLIEVPVKNTPVAFDEASADFQFAAAVAAFGMKLRNSPYAGDLSWSEIQKIARRNLGEDPGSYRAEFLTLIEKAARLQSGK
jgi:secreted protein with Ig-like and vWFA domain